MSKTPRLDSFQYSREVASLIDPNLSLGYSPRQKVFNRSALAYWRARHNVAPQMPTFIHGPFARLRLEALAETVYLLSFIHS